MAAKRKASEARPHQEGPEGSADSNAGRNIEEMALDELEIKGWREFTGKGIELIGDPTKEPFTTGTLLFDDGRFRSIGLPTREWSALDPPRWRFERGVRLAELVARKAASESEIEELHEILRRCRERETPEHPDEREPKKKRERRTENAVSRILKGMAFLDETENSKASGIRKAASPVWSFQDNHDQMILQAVSDLAREHSRPPKGWEVMERVGSYTGTDGGKIITGHTQRSDLDRVGFGWLAWREKVGFQWRECAD